MKAIEFAKMLLEHPDAEVMGDWQYYDSSNVFGLLRPTPSATTIEDMGLSVRAYNCLCQNQGSPLCRDDDANLVLHIKTQSIKNFGQTMFAEVYRQLINECHIATERIKESDFWKTAPAKWQHRATLEVGQ